MQITQPCRALPQPFRAVAPHARAKPGVRCATLDLQPTQEMSRLKMEFMAEVEGINRGLFGIKLDKQGAIHGIVEQLEQLNPLSAPADHLEHVDGPWRVLYCTIRIMGTKRSKLGLREFVKIGDIYQDIDIVARTAVQRVGFSVSGFGLISGEFRIDAAFSRSSSERVEVEFVDSALKPQQLLKLFEKNYDMLLSIFNPEGYLDITYVDADFRIGRDGRGNIFVLERCM